jgi:hypothetical protein
MSDKRTALDLTRRQILGGLGAIGVSAAGAGYGTTAVLSDRETVGNGRLVAGELDMRVGFEEHYANWSADEGSDLDGEVTMTLDGTLNSDAVGLPTQEPINGSPLVGVANASDAEQFLDNTAGESPDPGDEASDSAPDGFDAATVEDIDDPCGSDLLASDIGRPTIRLSDLKPGDFGEVTFSFALCDNPGFVWLTGRQVDASEGGRTEPEADDPDEGPGVELLDGIETAVWVDDGNNYQNGDESPAASGALREVLAAATPGDGAGNVDRGRTGVPLSGDLPAEDGGGRGRNCFAANETYSVVFAWWLPTDHGNEVQSDTVTFDLGFYTEQCRHNAAAGITGFETFSSTTATFAREGGAFVIEANGAGMFETTRSTGGETEGSA